MAKQTKREKLKEKSKQLFFPENCENVNVPLLNKEIWSQVNSIPYRGDLRMINLQESLQKAMTIA